MKKHLLLINEDKEELATFMDALNNINGSFKCTYAGSAAEALDVLRFIEPDFIFLDYRLSENSGLQVLSVIKEEPRYKTTKVFIYADDISEEISKMSRILGASGCIEKPATIARLIHEFRAIFAGDLLPDFALLKRM